MPLIRGVWCVLRLLLLSRSQLTLENLALRQQLAVLNQQRPRPRLRRHDRLNGQRMRRTGAERDFISPELTAGETYAYQVKARWVEDGRTKEETIEAKVHVNQTTTIRFDTSSLALRVTSSR